MEHYNSLCPRVSSMSALPYFYEDYFSKVKRIYAMILHIINVFISYCNPVRGYSLWLCQTHA